MNIQFAISKSFHWSSCSPSRLKLLPVYSRTYSAYYPGQDDEEQLNVAREWYSRFTKSQSSIVPHKLAKTSFSRSSGPGGQKVNKTSSKATTTWPLNSLTTTIPKVLHQGLKSSRYYVQSSDSISMQSDTHRGQTENEEENHRKLYSEIEEIYKRRVPGVTSAETKQKHVAFQKAANSARLKTKKMHGDKKRARSGEF